LSPSDVWSRLVVPKNRRSVWQPLCWPIAQQAQQLEPEWAAAAAAAANFAWRLASLSRSPLRGPMVWPLEASWLANFNCQPTWMPAAGAWPGLAWPGLAEADAAHLRMGRWAGASAVGRGEPARA